MLFLPRKSFIAHHVDLRDQDLQLSNAPVITRSSINDYFCKYKMNIAVNTRFLRNDNKEGYGYFLHETLSRIVQLHREHQFIFIFDKPYEKKFVFAKNVKPIVAGPPARHPLLWKYWYDIKIPLVLKKHSADVFVSCDGFCSLTTKVPQCLVVHDLSFLHYPSFIPRSHYLFYKRYTPSFLRRAASIATVSEFSKRDITSQYKIADEKIDVIPNAVRESFISLNDAEKEETKNKLTNGKEFFLCVGAIHPRKNLVNLLKAFSVFKKKQSSSWKLVLTGRLAWKNKHFVESLKTYKYRDDVVLTGYVDEQQLSRIMGSAYALVYPSFWEGFGMPVLEAMRCGVPVITSGNSAMQEITKNGALYINPAEHNDIAEKMMLLYKDESLRRKLIQQGLGVSHEYDWDHSAELLWQCIMKAIK